MIINGPHSLGDLQSTNKEKLACCAAHRSKSNPTILITNINGLSFSLSNRRNRSCLKICPSKHAQKKAEKLEQIARERCYLADSKLANSFKTWYDYVFGSSSISSNKSDFFIEEIESSMFKCLKRKCKRDYVHVRNGAIKIWTVSANTESSNLPIVLMHDFGAGSALWLPNIDELSEERPLYAFDLLGFGRSSRVQFSNDPLVAESQFIESIEDWRKELKLDKMILLGHGFGGFLASSYAIKYAQFVAALILVDPWGFAEKPSQQPDTPNPFWLSFLTRISHYLSPLTVFRAAGQSVGIGLLKFLRPDFKKQFLPYLDNPDLIYKYLFFLNCKNPTGEAGFMAMSDYFGYAKMPMIRRVEKIDSEIPIWFVYGSRSWIDPSSAFLTIYLRQDSVYTSVKLISGAGHYVHADRTKDFNQYTSYILDLVDEHEEKHDDYPMLPKYASAHQHHHSRQPAVAFQEQSY